MKCLKFTIIFILIPSLLLCQVFDSKSKNEKGTNNALVRKYINNSGIYLKKSAVSYSAMPTRTFNMITKENDPYMLMGLTLIVLPIELTLSRFYGEFASAYYFDKSGKEIIKGSDYVVNNTSLKFKNIGNNFKNCGKYGYVSGAFTAGGLGITTYALFNSFDNNNASNLFTIGFGSILAGRLLRLIPLHYARVSGEKLSNISDIFQNDNQNKLIHQAGVDIQNYSKRTYWGYYLQALGATLFLASGEDNSMKSIGLGTFILSWLIFDEIGLHSLKSAGRKLEELGDLIL